MRLEGSRILRSLQIRCYTWIHGPRSVKRTERIQNTLLETCQIAFSVLLPFSNTCIGICVLKCFQNSRSHIFFSQFVTKGFLTSTALAPMREGTTASPWLRIKSNALSFLLSSLPTEHKKSCIAAAPPHAAFKGRSLPTVSCCACSLRCWSFVLAYLNARILHTGRVPHNQCTRV